MSMFHSTKNSTESAKINWFFLVERLSKKNLLKKLFDATIASIVFFVFLLNFSIFLCLILMKRWNSNARAIIINKKTLLTTKVSLKNFYNNLQIDKQKNWQFKKTATNNYNKNSKNSNNRKNSKNKISLRARNDRNKNSRKKSKQSERKWILKKNSLFVFVVKTNALLLTINFRLRKIF